uniref:Orf100c n=1 Tax=Batis maritima TaxID=4436 RepID=A0A068BBR4_BATMA|nr:orf100c [Batis maritima]AIC83365.1 orf100c [Batis maritima]
MNFFLQSPPPDLRRSLWDTGYSYDWSTRIYFFFLSANAVTLQSISSSRSKRIVARKKGKIGFPLIVTPVFSPTAKTIMRWERESSALYFSGGKEDQSYSG